MIVGLGTDVIEVHRIKETIDRHGEHFLEHVFTRAEMDAAPGRAGKYPFFAGRWAAKEALSKALGTGIGASCAWTEIEILNDPLGKPHVALTGMALKTAASIGADQIHVSISHERALASAVAILERNAVICS